MLEPIWSSKTETATRVRQRIEAVLNYAKAMGQREGENPARWRGHLDQALARPRKARAVIHHAALPWAGMGDFMVDLAGRIGVAVLALRLLVLTAARPGEVRGAIWAEIDDTRAVWRLPASRTKARREHRIPLTPSALAVLREVAPHATSPSSLVFPGQRRGRALSDATLTAVLDNHPMSRIDNLMPWRFRPASSARG